MVPVPSSESLVSVAQTSLKKIVRSTSMWIPSHRDQKEAQYQSDDHEDRETFVSEYNALAQRYNVPTISKESPPKKGHKIPRLFSRHFRRSSSLEVTEGVPGRKDRIMDIETMYSYTGKGEIQLPEEFAPCSLRVPQCIQATGTYLANFGTNTPGIFRVTGSLKAINALCNYYLEKEEPKGRELPEHISCSTHDIGSAFKRLLSTLPGGLVESNTAATLTGIYRFDQDTQSPVVPQMIALAIGTIPSKDRRELLCAVLGLLAMISDSAERSDVAEMMNSSSLGIIFGPVLMGGSKTKRAKRRNNRKEAKMHNVDKALESNLVTEMLIKRWKEVVRQLKECNVLSTRLYQIPLLFDWTSESETDWGDIQVPKKRQDERSIQSLIPIPSRTTPRPKVRNRWTPGLNIRPLENPAKGIFLPGEEIDRCHSSETLSTQSNAHQLQLQGQVREEWGNLREWQERALVAERRVRELEEIVPKDV